MCPGNFRQMADIHLASICSDKTHPFLRLPVITGSPRGGYDYCHYLSSRSGVRAHWATAASFLWSQASRAQVSLDGTGCACQAPASQSGFRVLSPPLQGVAMPLLFLQGSIWPLWHPQRCLSADPGGPYPLHRPRELGPRSVACPPGLLVYHCLPVTRRVFPKFLPHGSQLSVNNARGRCLEGV